MYTPVNNLRSFTVLAWVYHQYNYQYGDVLVFNQGGNSLTGKILIFKGCT